MKTVLLALAYSIGLVELGFALFFWKTNGGNQTRRVAGTLAFAMSAWVILNALTAYREPSAFVDGAFPFVYVSVLVAVTAMVHLALLFPIPLVRIDRLHVFLLYLPTLLLLYPLFGTETVVSGYELNSQISGYATPGPIYPLFSAIVVVGFLLTSALLMKQIRRTDGVLRRNATIVLGSLFVPVLSGIVYNLPHELRGTAYNSMLVPLLTGFWALLTGIIVIKK